MVAGTASTMREKLAPSKMECLSVKSVEDSGIQLRYRLFFSDHAL